MKLYTEEQLRASYNDGVENGHCGYGREYEDQFINSLAPIKLPSDEEIKEAAKDYHWKNGVYYAQEKTFIDAIKWVIEQIKNQ